MTNYTKTMREALESMYISEDNVAILRDIVKRKSAMPLKFSDGKMKVDLFTASAVTQVLDKVNPANKTKLTKMINTGKKGSFIKIAQVVMKSENDPEVEEENEGFASDAQRRAAFAQGYKAKGKKDKKEEVKEDGHTDVSSAIRQCKTVLEDAMQIMGKLKSMSGEDSLPTWWTNKLAVASNSMNKMRDYILVPSDGMQEKLDKEDEPKVKEIVKKLKKASDAHAGQAKDLEKAVKETVITSKELLDNKYKEEKNGAQHFSKVNEDNYVWNFVYDDFGRTKLTTEPDKATHLVYTMEGKDNPQLLKLSEKEILDYKKGENYELSKKK